MSHPVSHLLFRLFFTVFLLSHPPLSLFLSASPDHISVPITVQVFENESNRETDKNESFADDANNFTVLKLDSLAKLKKILEAFRILSGLSCNVEKTSVMRIGNLEGEVDPEIQ